MDEGPMAGSQTIGSNGIELGAAVGGAPANIKLVF